MNIIIIILIFCMVLFLYLHIFFHLKTSEDLEIFEISNPSKERFEEICDLRQPIVLDYDISNFKTLNNKFILQNYSSFDIKIRNILNTQSDSELYLPITITKGLKVLDDDKSGKYISEKNEDFLQETSLIKAMHSNDTFLRPNMMATNMYDYILGSKDAYTPFRYDVNYRNFFIVLSGSIKIKMTQPKSGKYLYPENDYDNFEFLSPINPWNVSDKYKTNFDKIKCMEVNLTPGKLIFIPAYWWYSIKFVETNTTVLSFKYRTYMNTMAIFPQLFVSFLQKQNIKHNFVEKITTCE